MSRVGKSPVPIPDKAKVEIKASTVTVTGPKGSRLLVNTEGIHKGLPPQTHDRWLLQLLFGVSDFTQWGGSFEAPVLDAAGPAEAYLLGGLFPTRMAD